MQGFALEYLYTNWKGETRIRKIEMMGVWYGESEYHQGKQWFMHGLDVEKGEERDFAMKDLVPLHEPEVYH